MRSWKAVTLTSGTKAYWIIGALVSTVIPARFLGLHGRGVIAAATSSVAVFVTFGHLSLANVVVYLAGRGERARVLPIVTGRLLAITAAVTLPGWTISATMYVLTAGRAFQHIAPSVLLIAFATLPFLLWLENGNLLLVVFAVGVMKGGMAGAVAATLVSSVVVVGLGLTRVLRESRPLAISRNIMGELLGGGIRLHLGAVGTFFFTHAGVLLLNQYRPVAEAGYFQLAMQLTTATQVVPMAVAVVAHSLVARVGAALLSLVAAAIGLAGNYFFIPPYGMRACACVMVVSYSVHLVNNAAFAWWIERRARREPALAPLRG